MNWFAPINAYCERTGPEYWSEPVNAVTNAAFVIAALVMMRRLGGAGMGMGRALAAVLFIIGIGSWLFHTHANQLTSLLDVLPIVAFILLYIFAATRDFFGARPWVAGLVTAGFIPYAALLIPVFSLVPGLGSSASYAPVPLLIAIYALLLRRRLPEVARGLAIGAVVLIVSLTFRTLDQALCDMLPLGTHFMWHILNAVMLGWMIEVWRRHRAGQAALDQAPGRAPPRAHE